MGGRLTLFVEMVEVGMCARMKEKGMMNVNARLD